ncbi:MBL fold metallo-hydrolase [Nocardia huaxiensis]|uniref:MBL fold metallo-hydrolase n=1 Tax=Nocardia huaxiensis TaxID=2755382 RepID=UPI001E46FA9A|nr:MBL fold metallo-hydrolase [Nocardia huaxiensis]UFS95458.1 MBL fold metallo-hydrolase [Nocardia huaxiensis]
MKIHHLNCGTMVRGLVNHCLLLETESGLVLVDTGFGLNCVRRPGEVLGPTYRLLGLALDENETAIRQVAALGYAPEDVRHIIVTHLDYDHVGGLADFPWATVHIHGPEYRALLKPGLVERFAYRKPQLAHGPKWEVNEWTGGERWFGFRAVRELSGLPEEILAIPLYGHRRGHIGVAVDTGSGWLLHAGDTIVFRAEYDATQPGSKIGGYSHGITGVGPLDWLANLRRLRTLHREHADEVTIISSHDPAAFAEFAHP